MTATSLLSEDHGLLWLGSEGEETYGRKNFMALLSSFTAAPLFRVLHGQQEIGFIDQISLALRNDEKPVILLAGRGWQVAHLDWDARVAFVTPSELKGRSQWLGSSPILSFDLCQSVQHVIADETNQPHWSRRACDAIRDFRFDMPWCQDSATAIVSLGPDSAAWWTFAGLRVNATLAEAFISLGVKASADNFSITVHATLNDIQTNWIDQVRSVAPQLWPVSLGTKAIENLNFVESIPVWIAQEMFRSRLNAAAGIKSILEQKITVST